MGQYWMPVNLTKREFIAPHRLGTGLKLWEQLANSPGTGAALIVLCAAMPEPRGSGDFDLDENWHGPERDEAGPMPNDYPAVAKRTIGRWAGDRIALVGDYAKRGDLLEEWVADGQRIRAADPADTIYIQCVDYPEDEQEARTWFEEEHPGVPWRPFKDVTDDVCRVIEHELGGTYSGDGWRTWTAT